MSKNELKDLILIPLPTQEQLNKADVVTRYLVAAIQRNNEITENTNQTVEALQTNQSQFTNALVTIKERHATEDSWWNRVKWIFITVIIPLFIICTAHYFGWKP